MTTRPVDSSGDILPVLSTSDLFSGPAAIAEAIRNRLHLNTGDWWENPSHGLPLFELMQSTRLTEADLPTITNLITSQIESAPEVQSVTEVASSFSDHRVTYSATVHTAQGSASFSVSLP